MDTPNTREAKRMNISSVITRCADLARPFPEMRSKRVAIEQTREHTRVGATDGHVAARFTLAGPAITPGGNYTAIGAEFPKWGASAWKIRSGEGLAAGKILVCEAYTQKGARTAATKKRDWRAPIREGRGVGLNLWDAIHVGKRASAGSLVEIGEIRDALEYLHENVTISFVSNGGPLQVVAGPLVANTRLALPLTTPMRFTVGVLDRALDLLDGFDGGGLTWDFPVAPLDPVIIKSSCGRAEVLAMPLN